MTKSEIDRSDEHVDEEIIACLDMDAPKSFFLFAGAGSGKTRSLVNALDHVRRELAPRLSPKGRRVAVITYTNAACDEILRRTHFSPIIKVSTIHSFAWSLIEGATNDIREWLRTTLNNEIIDLRAEEAKGRPGTKASAERLAKIEAKSRRLASLDDTHEFAYDPNGDNSGRDSLSHAEVLKIAADFIKHKPAMQGVLIDGFPFILIDESQDTNKLLVEALFNFERAHSKQVSLGLFGDMMQRIYADGKQGLGEGLPSDWAKPTKKLNWRCPKRVVELINKIRQPVDGQMQVAWSGAPEGWVRMFVLPSEGIDKQDSEQKVAAHMASITGDDTWLERDGHKALILEHHMAARRMGFSEMFSALYSFDSFRTGLIAGTLPLLTLFTDRVLPIIEAKDDKFEIFRIVRAHSPLVNLESFQQSGHQASVLTKAKDAVASLLNVARPGAFPTFGDVLENVIETGLFPVRDELRTALANVGVNEEESAPAGPLDNQSERGKAIDAFLSAPFEQIKPYVRYVSRASGFDTHQGVKGLEFPRVMVVMDDAEARGFAFKYEKLFGGAAGEDNVTAATRRLFYVTCSRAERSLALVAYTKEPERVRDYVIRHGWLKDNEVVVGI